MLWPTFYMISPKIISLIQICVSLNAVLCLYTVVWNISLSATHWTNRQSHYWLMQGHVTQNDVFVILGTMLGCFWTVNPKHLGLIKSEYPMIFEIYHHNPIKSWHECKAVSEAVEYGRRELQRSVSFSFLSCSLAMAVLKTQQMEALQVGESKTSVPGDAGEIKLRVYVNIARAVGLLLMVINVYMPTPPQLNRLTGWDAFDFFHSQESCTVKKCLHIELYCSICHIQHLKKNTNRPLTTTESQ